ncbi:hypothetical protein L2E82_51067 [Cichorium intybus]|nr:hypothetical protein L2E82_51067 [Cichorium intybus]
MTERDTRFKFEKLNSIINESEIRDISKIESQNMKEDLLCDNLQRIMIRHWAQVSNVKKTSILAAVAVALAAASTVSAQGPAPSPDAGAAFSLPTSGVLVGTSLLFSFIALFRN